MIGHNALPTMADEVRLPESGNGMARLKVYSSPSYNIFVVL